MMVHVQLMETGMWAKARAGANSGQQPQLLLMTAFPSSLPGWVESVLQNLVLGAQIGGWGLCTKSH